MDKIKDRAGDTIMSEKEIKKVADDFLNNLIKIVSSIVDKITDFIEIFSNAFLKMWQELNFDFSILDKKISRKRLTKLIMSIGYQRNEANMIAKNIHKEKGKYAMYDFGIVKEKEKCMGY